MLDRMRDRGDLEDSPPTPADILRALGPDYQEALAQAIAVRLDELARRREDGPDPRQQEALKAAERRGEPSRERSTSLASAVALRFDELARRFAALASYRRREVREPQGRPRGHSRHTHLRILALLASLPIAFGTILSVRHATTPAPTNPVEMHPVSAAVKGELLTYQSCMLNHGVSVTIKFSAVWGYSMDLGGVGARWRAADAACGAVPESLGYRSRDRRKARVTDRSAAV